MAEYALRLTNSTDTAPRVRRGDGLGLQHDGNLNTRSGLRPDGGGVVSHVAGTMTVDVSPFSAWVDGGNTPSQGGYPFILDAVKNLAVADGDATFDRTDTIAAVVYEDAYDASGLTSAELVVVQGTPGAGAPAPVLPSSCVPLRDVLVTAGLSAGTGGLTASNIGADRRTYTAAAGGVVPVTGATDRDAIPAVAGQAVYRQDTGSVEVFNGTDWDTYAPHSDSGWVTLTPASGTGTIRCRKLNGVVYFDGTLTGSFTSGTVYSLVAAGGVPADMRPTARANVQLSGHSAASSVRGYVEASGELVAVTGSSVPTYIALAGFSSSYLTD